MNLPIQEPPRRTVGFKEVEVIELPIVAGHNHPSHHFEVSGKGRDEGSDYDETDCEQFDSAAITLDWQAQTRTKINVDEFEEKKKRMRMGKKLQRMSRAVRKRILRNIGVETSDIESEDERHATKSRKKKKKSKKKTKKKSTLTKDSSARSFRMNPFRFGNDSASMPPMQPQDRFSSGSQEYKLDHADSAPKLPQRRDNPLGLPPSRPRAGSDDDSSLSPSQSRRSIELNRNPALDSPGRAIRARNLNFLFPNTSTPQFQENVNPLESPTRQRRKSQFDNVAIAIGVLASQPVKLAKQPVRLAKYTGKKVRQGVGRVRRSGRESSDDDDDMGLESEFDNPSYPYVDHAPGEAMDVSNRSGTHSSRVVSSDHVRNFDYRYDNDTFLNAETETPLSPTATRRRSSLSHVTNVIGVLAKQPVILAKQPVRLAKYTTKRVRKRVNRARNPKSSDDDDEDDDSLEGIDQGASALPPAFPPRPPLCFQSSSSSLLDSDDDFDILAVKDEPTRQVPATYEGQGESGDEEINDSKHIHSDRIPHHPSRRRSSLQHMTNAIGTVAKQPYKLAKYTAKQPIKLAKYTGNSIRKRMRKKKDDDSLISNPEEHVVSEDDTILDYNEGLDATTMTPNSKEQPPKLSLPVGLLSPMLDTSDGNSSIDYSESLNDGEKARGNSNDSIDLSDALIDDLDGASEDEDILDPDSIHEKVVTTTTTTDTILSTNDLDSSRVNGDLTIPMDIIACDFETMTDEEKDNSFQQRGTKSYRISMAGDVQASDEFLQENGVNCGEELQQ